MRNLEELYDTTQVIEDTTLFCFHADSDLEKNDTLKLTYPPEKKKAIGVKRVYKTKAKLVDKGYKKKEGIEERSIHAWHDIPRLSLRGRFVELNSIQKVLVKEGNHPPPTSCHRPAASHQPTATNRPPTATAFTPRKLNFVVLISCINRHSVYVICVETIKRNTRKRERERGHV